ncbi:superfamily I DNA/RNA helicase-like protein (plasmid) [Thioalkalivibrio sp. K90mix]|uniref:UvrD-helicase domain-containing protein n=1 Tax=Thioalkalivibrio sp. (strain K90mix) TaxID=396595 RepID=UPI000195A695|nr:UvrD-helicase domain-containing protein [Thioalkalivibrio sp. K90mix]ADC73272.1 superfamily I DNA/RNA helicase-like protein [Thioalkalivibrio sp. K90mix]
MKPTAEQRKIIESSPHESLAVEAFAGAAKTTTLEWRARAHPSRRFLNLAFNKSVNEDAKTRFPASNTTCKTTHGLAFYTCGRAYANTPKKLGTPKPYQAERALQAAGRRSRGAAYAAICLDVVAAYCASPDEDLHEGFVSPEHAALFGVGTGEVARDARFLWEAMRWLNNPLPMSHDGYLKLYQLSQPDLTGRFDCIILDEAQDTNAAVFDLLVSQGLPLVVVGDTYQSIYAFRRSVDVMNRVPGGCRYSLTQSFRFGPEIAEVANTLLGVFLDPKHLLIGAGPRGAVLTQGQWEYQGSNAGAPPCHLSRTRAGVFQSAVEAHEAGLRVAWWGGVKSYELWVLREVQLLADGRHRKIRDPLMQRFATVDALEEFAQSVQDRELLARIRIQRRFGKRLYDLVERLQEAAVRDVWRADRIVSTAHRAKGAEFPVVVLGDDFPALTIQQRLEQTGKGERVPRTEGWIDRPGCAIPEDPEIYLLYVALTRAKKVLVMSKELEKLTDWAGVVQQGHRYRNAAGF